MNIALISDYLETYQGRDKFLRTLSYMAKFATLNVSCEDTEKKLKIFSSQMSGCRVVLRLLDDIPVIHHAIMYGYGKKEPDCLMRWTELMQIAVDIIYCPIEHVTWAGEQNLITINTKTWDNVATWFWILSLHLSLFKTWQKLKKFNKYKKQLDESNSVTIAALKSITKQRWNEILTCTRLVLDISFAISYLPPGTLWGGKLKVWHVGALGSLSSFIGLYQALSQRADQKKYS